jgi:chitosanase
VKPLTRVVLFGAPIAVAVSVYFGGSGESLRPKDDPSLRVSPTAFAPDPLKAGSPAQQRERDDRIDALPPGLADPAKKEIAAQLVASAENSTLDWKSRYGAIEDIGDGNGYTAGIIGFCSGTNDMLQLVEYFTDKHPDNPLAGYLPALREVDGSDSHEGLGAPFEAAWAKAAEDPEFRKAQDVMRDRIYFDPAVRLAKMDGLSTLGQFIYYDAMVLHGPGLGPEGFYGIREAAMKAADTAAEGGDEKAYLNAFLDAGRTVIGRQKTEQTRDSSRIDTAQRVFLRAGNMDLDTPLTWRVYGETFRIGS